jgi:xanthine dehydrogenase accessory factor
VVVAESRCASEGVVEVLIEPELPGPLLAVVGEGVAGRTLRELARIIGWRVTDRLDPDAEPDAVVVATMGHGDEDALELALKAGVDYVGLVASARRAGVVLDALGERGVAAEDLARVRGPAGRDLGPSSQEEIAVAILAELVDWRHGRVAAAGRDGAPASAAAADAQAVASGVPAAGPAEAVDPVCGMTVAVAGAPTAVRDGVTSYFCSVGCRDHFERSGE